MFLRMEKSARTVCSDGASPSINDRKSEVQLTLGQMIGQNARRSPHQPAIVSSGFAPLTYQDLQRQLAEIRRQLRKAGFDCRARIGVLMPNGPEALLAIVAVACCSTAVPLDPRLSLAEIDRRLDMLRLNALLVPQGGASDVRPIAQQRGLAIIEAALIEHDRLELAIAVQASDCPASDAEPDPCSAAFILQTSGTTAQPKLIPFSHANMLAAAARLQAWFDLTPQDRCLSISPPYYSHGLKVTIFTPLLTGGSIAIPANVAVPALDEWFDALRPTWYSAGPTLHNAVLDKATSLVEVQAAHTLRFVLSGGAPLPKEVQNGLQGILGVPVLEHYGSSEAAQIAANQPQPGLNKPGTCGKPWPDTVAIVGGDGDPVPPGERGEVWIRGPTVMSGYLDAPELNQAAFVRGWFRTGDIGSLDRDGFLSLHGRLSELINRGGEKIAPAEIDSALQRHPAVAEAAAFAIPHPRLGEDVAVAVVLRPGARTTPADLRQFLRSELASFKIPRRILILGQLPKGATGKVQRRWLSESHGALLDRPVAAPVRDVTEQPLDLESELLRLWRKLLKFEAMTVDDDFFDSGGDSLLAMEMLMHVEQIIGHSVPETILFGAETIRQLAAKLATKAAMPATPFFHFNADSNRTPLFFFNGDLVSGSSCMRQMVKLIGHDHPIITIDPHGLRGEPIPSSIEKMATDRLPLILERHPSGPVVLGGKCNGAMVAFEAARQLMASGRKVELVAMVDPPTVNARPVPRAILGLMEHMVSPRRLRWTFELMACLERFFKRSTSEQISTLQKQFSKLPASQQIAKMFDALSNPNKEIPPSLWETYSIAMAQYRPAPLDVPVVFYSADHDGRSWRHLSPRLEVIQVPGGHRDCLTIGAGLLVTHLRHKVSALSGDVAVT
ncbi:AMP-binding protein [Microvirga calopogonii]|uniref:AMP-binding protein n=1 Tax=Microvirga calopogonii TaxID=2078013 RepID=UPI001FE230F2|nr:AMP-binding protein [Microvirga calopogonii]